MRADPPQGKGEWKSRESSDSCTAVLQALCQKGMNASEGKLTAWGEGGSPRPWEQLPIPHPGTGLSWDWGLCAGLSQRPAGKREKTGIPLMPRED